MKAVYEAPVLRSHGSVESKTEHRGGGGFFFFFGWGRGGGRGRGRGRDICDFGGGRFKRPWFCEDETFS